MSYFEYEPSKWTKENCFIKAQECKTRGDFKKKYPNAYEAALDNGWLNELFVNHPNHVRNPPHTRSLSGGLFKAPMRHEKALF